ncbi:thioesterase II family protein [Streptomyces sp. NPDC091287]|uniref:thioesterase II family protein n=1 Tax=Streptomyces sp. NPDC091287 TaxID=3365988 RepID=UPI00382A6E72
MPEAVLAEPEMVGTAVDLFRAGLHTVDSYRYRPGDRVRAPVQVLRGELDSVDDAAVDQWRALTDGGLTEKQLPGGHFYTPRVWARLPDHIDALTPSRLG